MKIVIWTGMAWETWGPESINAEGLGGSETAVIHMAAELTALGHEVAVIGQVKPGNFAGVSYEDYRDYLDLRTRKIECDVFISSRDLHVLRLLSPKARLSVLWMHDLSVGEDTAEELLGYDYIFVLSKYAFKYALNCYPHVPRTKYVVTRNGIDPNRFLLSGETADTLKSIVKSGCRAIYSSSYDRGLDRLLAFWPKIRELRSDAELHVYYGLDNAEKSAVMAGNKCDRNILDYYRYRLASMEEHGVVVHGRVGQQDLAMAFLDSSLWLYPTNFHETSCITAMEAQAAGVFSVTSRLGALPETLKYGRFIDPPNTDLRYEEAFLGIIRKYLNGMDPIAYSDLIDGRSWALRKLAWSGVAADWHAFFEEILA